MLCVSEEKDYRREDLSAVAEEELSSKTDRNIGEWFGVEPFSSTRSVLHIVRGSYEIPSLSRPLPWHDSIIAYTKLDSTEMICWR